MSSEAPSVPTEAVVAQNEGGGGVGESTTSTSPVVPPVSTATESAPSEVVESKPTAEVPLSQRLKVTMDMPVSAPTSKKERPKLVLAPWQPDDGVSECQHCKRTFNPLFLRFKHHCRICGNIFCGSCTKQTPVRQADLPPELLTCLPCNEAELKRQEKEIKKQQARDALKLEQEHLSELFVELQKAFEANDEPTALLLKSEIDRLKDKMVAREQARQARKDEKTKEKKAAKLAKKAAAAAEKEAAGGKTGTGAAKTGAGAAKSSTAAKKGAKATTSKPVVKKPLDTPETIAAKLESRYSLEPSKLINPPADPNRKCLVLDIDYTLFDHKWQPQVRSDLRSNKTMIPLFKRPYLHEFLATCNLRYDIIIWSATGMPAIDNKVGNLGIYTSDRYKLTAVLCKEHMIHVTKPRKGGRTYDETVKPLSVIWKRFPECYNPTNTIHIDDMISNFQLNPQNGIHISPYKESSTSLLPDTELQYLTKYLMLIAETESDFTKLPHSKWKEWLIDRLWQDSLLSVKFPMHTPDPPIDPTFLIAAELASKTKKGAAAAASAIAAIAAAPLAVTSTTSASSSSTTTASSGASPSGSSASITSDSASTAIDIPRPATPAGTPTPSSDEAKLSSTPSTPSTPTASAASQFKIATLSRSNSGANIGASNSGLSSPKSPTSSPDAAKFPNSSSPTTAASSASSTGPLERMASNGSITIGEARPLTPISPSASSSNLSTPPSSEARSWVRSAFPRPTLSNSVPDMPQLSSAVAPSPPPSSGPTTAETSTTTTEVTPATTEANTTTEATQHASPEKEPSSPQTTDAPLSS